jgi:hypothetical protein
MLNDQERRWIYDHAYLPEHLPDYVGAIAGAEPFLHRSYLYFIGKKHLIFNGYPLEPEPEPPDRVYDFICERHRPATVTVITSDIWLPGEQYEQQGVDSYYRLDLPLSSTGPGVGYMIRRAQRDLRVTRGRFGKEHKKIVKAFVARQRFNRQQKHLFKQIPQYLKISQSSVLFEARQEDKLAAFNIVDLGAADYAFYLFSFRSSQINVPGASDLLFHEMVKLAQAEGKKAVNLGLGVNAGIRRFKEKWGGVPFADYQSVVVDKREMDIGRLAKKL